MKASELIGHSDEQIALTLRDTEKHLFQLRFQSATDRLETPSEIRKAKKDIARIKTEQRRRELKKLAEAGYDDLTQLASTLEPKIVGPGKRRVKRSLARVNAIRETKAPKPAQTTKGK